MYPETDVDEHDEMDAQDDNISEARRQSTLDPILTVLLTTTVLLVTNLRTFHDNNSQIN